MNRVSVVILMALMRLPRVGRRAALRATSGVDFRVETQSLVDEQIRARLAQMKLDWAEFDNARLAVEDQLDRSEKAGISAIAYGDDAYPQRLKTMPDPPAVLFIKGDAAGLSTPRNVAVVGTREPTDYGEKVARRIGETAARDGCTVVSGLAHGCDTYGHEGCLEGGGVAVAVLAHGLDKVYPAANRGLADRILDGGGCLVSEYPIGMTPARTAFAERDRIQSGLSDGVIVIETDVKGGTMHTVRFALEQRRALACVQHPSALLSEPKTQGNQQLIRERKAAPLPDGAALAGFLQGLAPAGSPAERAPAPLNASSQMSWSF